MAEPIDAQVQELGDFLLSSWSCSDTSRSPAPLCSYTGRWHAWPEPVSVRSC
jgi:hypothetical protein